MWNNAIFEEERAGEYRKRAEQGRSRLIGERGWRWGELSVAGSSACARSHVTARPAGPTPTKPLLFSRDVLTPPSEVARQGGWRAAGRADPASGGGHASCLACSERGDACVKSRDDCGKYICSRSYILLKNIACKV